MKRFHYDKIFILIGDQRIPQQVAVDAIRSANEQAEIIIERLPTFAEVYKETKGSFWTSGLIPSTPKEELVARFGVAWLTDFRGRKHVRVLSDLKNVKFHETNCLWPSNNQPYQLVYPKIVYLGNGSSYGIFCECGAKVLLEDENWNGQKCFACQERDRYERETGFQMYVPKTKKKR